MDLSTFYKLLNKYTIISVKTLKTIATKEQINIMIYTKYTTRSKLEKVFETGNVFQYTMHLQAKYFNEANDYALSDLTMILNPDFEADIYNSLKNKLKITTWTSAMS